MKKYIEKYIDTLKSERKSENTLSAYQRDLEYFENYLKQKEFKWNSLKKMNITAYINYLSRKGKAEQTITRSVVTLRNFYNCMYRMGEIDKNPMIDIKPPKFERKLPGTISVADVEKFLSQPDLSTYKGIRDKAMLELVYATGIKVSQLIKLKMRDVDVQAELITCNTENDRRTVPYGSFCAASIRNYLEVSKEKEPDDYFFTNLSGTGMSRQGFWKIIKQYTVSAGLNKDVSPQILRHSFAVHMINNGLDTKTLQELMGYTALASTQIYEDINRNRIKEIYKTVHPRA